MTEWVIEHGSSLIVIVVIAIIGWMMGKQDGKDLDDDGTLRHDKDGEVWVFNDGEWKQLVFRTRDYGFHVFVKIGDLVGATIPPLTKKQEAGLPPKQTVEEFVINESLSKED